MFQIFIFISFMITFWLFEPYRCFVFILVVEGSIEAEFNKCQFYAAGDLFHQEIGRLYR